MNGGVVATIDNLAPLLNARIEAFEELLAERFPVAGEILFPEPSTIPGAKLVGLRWRRANGGWGLDAVYGPDAVENVPLTNASLADRAAATSAFAALWGALEDNEARRISDVKEAIARIDDLLAEKGAKLKRGGR